uniref:Interleukin 17a/f1 n=1 Tax=Echeneis naucrates TaxID=173247 RepID=A0A665WVD2_ECHNA
MASRIKIMGFCVVAMMMVMMMAEGAAMPKEGAHLRHSPNTHKTSDRAIKTVPLELDASSMVPAKPMRPLENSSISPWTYNVSYDESLYPHLLSEARCLLKGCLNSEGQEDQNLESRPIMRQTLVLRRVRPQEAGQSYHYKLEYRIIAVGCTCVRPIIQYDE